MSRTPRLDAARSSLVAKTPKSRELSRQRAEILNAGFSVSSGMPYPILLESGRGSRVFDADGNEYIDASMGFGLHVLGHRHDAVHDAIVARADKGWMFGMHTAAQMPLAELLCEASPCAERVVFCNTGTEATLYAMRAARAFTGREKVALFDGAYHGAHDYGIVMADPSSPVSCMRAVAMGHGVPTAIPELMVMLPYRHDAAFDRIRAMKDELAAVMVEGVQSSNPQPAAGAFLQELAAVCRQSGVLFMIDEVITGFRLSYGGAQGYFDVRADIATYGKALGGGLPIGAIAGRADVMDVFAAFGAQRGIFSGGTFSGNPMSMAAGAAAVEYMKAHPEIYPYMNGQGEYLASTLSAFVAARGMPVQINIVGSMFHLFFQREAVASARDVNHRLEAAERAFYLTALDRGVLVPATQRAFLSAAHSAADVDTLIHVFQDSLLEVQADGLFD